MRLYENTAELLAIETALEESGGEITPEIEAKLDALELDRSAKVDAICKVITQLKRDAESVNLEVSRLVQMASTREKAKDSLMDYLKSEMEKRGETKIETPIFRVSVCRNSRPSIYWGESMDVLPADFSKIETLKRVDSAKALDAYKAGTLPSGFVATLGTHVRIR